MRNLADKWGHPPPPRGSHSVNPFQEICVFKTPMMSRFGKDWTSYPSGVSVFLGLAAPRKEGSN